MNFFRKDKYTAIDVQKFENMVQANWYGSGWLILMIIVYFGRANSFLGSPLGNIEIRKLT